MPTKHWYESKTVWISIAQAIAGIIVAILATDPNVKGAGILATIKAAVDFYIRLNTDSAIVSN